MADHHPQPICAFSVAADGTATPIAAADVTTKVKPNQYKWLHFDLSDPAFATWVEQALPTTVHKALLQTETRPRCDRTEGGLILNLRGVNLNPGADPDDMVSLRIWVTDGLIISTRVRKIFAVDAIRDRMTQGSGPNSINAFLAELAYALTKRIETVSLELVEDTDTLEEQSLQGKPNIAGDLAELRQSVIKLRRFVRPQSDAIDDLAAGNARPLDVQTAEHLRETANRAKRTLEELDSTADRLKAIQDHLDVVHATALGRNSYVLSVVAAIFLPLGFLTGLFGINVGGMPWVQAQHGFWLVSGGSVLIGFFLFYLFRHLKWL